MFDCLWNVFVLYFYQQLGGRMGLPSFTLDAQSLKNCAVPLN